jgi:hypothetical protein
MAVVEIQRVQVAAANNERLRAFSLDAPRGETTSDVYDIEIHGWVLGAQVPAVAVEVHAEGTVLRRAPLDQQRPDVAREYPDAGEAAMSGFRLWVGLIGLEPGVDLQVRAVLADETRVRLGGIKLSHQPLATGFTPAIAPLMLTTMGRAGTTWTMRLLSEHPQIVVHRWHPYELRTARYWWHMLKVLADPRDPYRSAQADRFQTDKSYVGHNPFYPEPMLVTPGLREWFGRTYVEDLGAFCQRQAEECYRRIGGAQGQPDPVYFAEKHRADALPWLVWELYPRAKEIFLVRDFRDVVSSMLAFNVKHGRRVFGPEHVASDEEFAVYLRNSTVRQLARSWPKRQDRAHLIRYEDLIEQPLTTLRGMLTYLELEADEATAAGMLDRASAENPEMRRHLTSSDVSTSIGRWRQSLSPRVQGVCNEVYADVLQQFGYTV